jgi:hypothetical protein
MNFFFFYAGNCLKRIEKRKKKMPKSFVKISFQNGGGGSHVVLKMSLKNVGKMMHAT